MAKPARSLLIGFAVIVTLSLAGLPDVAGMVGLALMLGAILVLAIGPTRPPTRAARKGRARARRINYLSRYGDALDPAGLGTALISGFAAWEIARALRVETDLPLLVALFALAVAVFALRGALRRWLLMGLSIGGALAAAVTVHRTGTREAWIVLLVAMTIGLMAVVVTRCDLPFLPGVLYRRRGLDGVELLLLSLFGLLELAGFLASPSGYDIWAGGASQPAVLLALVLFAVVAIVAAYGPELVISLVGIGLLLANVYLMGVEMRLTALAAPSDTTAQLLVVMAVSCGAALGLRFTPVG